MLMYLICSLMQQEISWSAVKYKYFHKDQKIYMKNSDSVYIKDIHNG